MKERGKAVAVSSNNCFSDYYSSSSDLPCKKHPSSPSVGICAFCLKDRLIKLVCSDCGEQRLSSCSCSDISSSYPNSCSVEIGSVGRISFLIENDKEEIPHSNTTPNPNPNPPSEDKSESIVPLKRSNSISFEVKRSGFWSFGRFFRKKRDKASGFSGVNVGGVDEIEKGEMWVFKNMGVSRSRSVGCFRGGIDDSEGGFTASDSGFNGVKKGGFIELDDGGFNGVGDSGFIDLKLGFSSKSKLDFSCVKSCDFLESESGFRVSKNSNFTEHESHSFECVRGDKIGISGHRSSCRIAVNDEEMKKCRKSLKVWKWILKHHHSSGGSTTGKKAEGHNCKS